MKVYIKRLVDLRVDSDLTQKQVGAILNKSQQGYAHIENGKAQISVDDLTTLCNYYNVSPEYILGFTDEAKKLK